MDCQNKGGIALDGAVKAAGLTRQAVEKELGMSAGYMSRLVNGERLPSRQLALRLRDRFGVGLGLWDEPIPAESGSGEAPPSTEGAA